MHQLTPGARFESRVIAALRRTHRCDIATSEKMDLYDKIDGEIRRVDLVALKMPVQLQLTRRIDHFSKLNAYLNSRTSGANVVSLYVEVIGGVSISETAEHIAWAATEVQGLEPYRDGCPIFGLRIDDDAAFFDLFERRRELNQERSSPERLAALQTGTVYRIEEGEFWIMDDASHQVYRAHYVDVSDGPLRRSLRNGEVQTPVRFLPVAHVRATDVRSIQSSRRRSHH